MNRAWLWSSAARLWRLLSMREAPRSWICCMRPAWVVPIMGPSAIQTLKSASLGSDRNS